MNKMDSLLLVSEAEIGYSQTQKEALAIVWAVKRLHKFLFGLSFHIKCDHESLRHIFCPKASISKSTSSMLQRWALFLSGYNYTIEYKAGVRIPHADYLSRYGLETSTAPDKNSSLFLQPLPLNRNDLREETKRVYGSVLSALKRGWSSTSRKKFHDLYLRREELSISVDGLLVTKDQIIIPPLISWNSFAYH